MGIIALNAKLTKTMTVWLDKFDMNGSEDCAESALVSRRKELK